MCSCRKQASARCRRPAHLGDGVESGTVGLAQLLGVDRREQHFAQAANSQGNVAFGAKGAFSDLTDFSATCSSNDGACDRSFRERRRR
jgi:hypothetical protein